MAADDLRSYWHADDDQFVVPVQNLEKFRVGDIPTHSSISAIPKTAAAACVRTACPPTSQQVNAKTNRYES